MATWSSMMMAMFVKQIGQQRMVRTRTIISTYSTIVQGHVASNANTVEPLKDQFNSKTMSHYSEKDAGGICRPQVGENVPRKDKTKFLISTLNELKDSKEAVYSALDAWVAWEDNFPIGQLKRALLTLEKEQQWHRVVQVIKWMLSKGQGTTLGTYGQLIRALDMDHRAAEAHEIWIKKLGTDLHSVPWQLCHLMISVYYRNNMMENLVRLFKRLEAYGRKPPEKSIVQKVSDACELLGLLEEKEQVLEKYKDLFTEKRQRFPKKTTNSPSKKKAKSTRRKYAPN